MKGETIQFIFWFLVMFLLSIFVGCLMGLYELFKPKKRKYRASLTRRKRKEQEAPLTDEQGADIAQFEESMNDCKERVLKASDLSDVPPIEEVIKAKSKKKSGFKDLRQIVKQRGDSNATPVIKKGSQRRPYKPEYNTPSTQAPNTTLDDAIKALISLGYKEKASTKAVQQALSEYPEHDTPQLISHALKLF